LGSVFDLPRVINDRIAAAFDVCSLLALELEPELEPELVLELEPELELAELELGTELALWVWGLGFVL
jgi:hypothetical protein